MVTLRELAESRAAAGFANDNIVLGMTLLVVGEGVG